MTLRGFLIPLVFPLFVGAQTLSLDLTRVPVNVTPQSLVVADFNNDGKLDLAVTGSEGSVEILLGNGDGTFRSAHVIPVGGVATRILKADFNQDGKLDLAVAAGSGGQVVVLLGNGDGSFQTPIDSGAKGPSGQVPAQVSPGLSAGDINGDGKIDLVLGPYQMASSSVMAVLLGKGDGTFQPAVITSIDLVDTGRAVVADVYGSGKPAVFLTGNNQAFDTAVLTSAASGALSMNWSTRDFVDFVWNGFPIAIGDANGNGRPDVVAIHSIEATPDRSKVLRAYAYLDGGSYSDGSLKLVTSDVTVLSDATLIDAPRESLALADMDGDGVADLLMSDSMGDLFVMFGRGDGTFHGAATFYTGASRSFTSVFADLYGSMTTGDFRGVGKQDVILVLAGKSVMLMKHVPPSPPKVVAAGVVNAASLAATPAVPGSISTIYGEGFSYDSGAVQNLSYYPDVTYAPELLFGASVTVNGVRTPFIWASPTQLNVQIPWEAAGQNPSQLTITRNGASQTITIPVATYGPGLFTITAQGTGQAAAVIAGTTGAVPAPVGALPGSRPIHRGEFLSLYGTGLGPVNPSFLTGYVTPPPSLYPTNDQTLHRTTTLPTVTVGGVSAVVQFSGLAPYMVGGYQINIQIPAAAPVGDAVPVVLSIGSVAANTVTIAVQ